jgi:hypothetical protein
MIQDESPVLVTLAPPIRDIISCGAVLPSCYTNFCLDYFPYINVLYNVEVFIIVVI